MPAVSLSAMLHVGIVLPDHRDPLGVRVELVDTDMRAVMEQFMFRAPVG